METKNLNITCLPGYLDEQGVLKAAFFRRYNFRANLENKVRDWLKVGANISYSDNSKNGITTGMGAKPWWCGTGCHQSSYERTGME